MYYYIVSVITCLVLSINLAAQNPVNPNGYNVFYFPSGKKSSEGNLKNGKPEGYWVTYFESGIKKSEGNRVNFKLDSNWIFYTNKGYKQKEVYYVAGVKSGPVKQYGDSGRLLSIDYFVKDTLHGIAERYYRNGKIKEYIPFENGVKEGTGRMLAHDDSRLIGLTNYVKGSIASVMHFNRKDNAGRKQAKWMDFYKKTGKLKRERAFKNDRLHGYTKYYNEKGRLDSAVLFINGERQEESEELMVLDVRKDYYNNGVVKSEGPYNLNGEKHGNFTIYDQNGNVIGHEFYKRDILLEKGEMDDQGRRQGPWEMYYVSGKIKAKGSYKNDLKTGEWLFTFEDGSVEQKGAYAKGGKPHGKWIWYFPGGQIWRTESFRKGKEDGMLEEYLPDGTLITKGEFIDGLKDGPWFYEMGDHKEEGEYRNGERHGLWKHTHASGQVMYEGAYVDGDPDGEHTEYFENGRIRLEGKYTLGLKTGVWKQYEETGLEFISILYKNGEVFKIDGARVKQE